MSRGWLSAKKLGVMLPGGLAAYATLAWTGAGLSAEVRSSAVLSAEYVYRQYQREDGLPDNQIRAILPSRSGYLWVATRFGLARFDGTRFAGFNHLNTPELGSGDCRALTEDSAGNLWFICEQLLFRMEDGRPVLATPGRVAQGITSGSLWGDRLGRIWAGYASHLTVCLPDGGVRQLVLGSGVPDLLTAVGEPEPGRIWLGSLLGLHEVDPVNWRFPRVQPELPFTGMSAMAFGRRARGGCWVLFSDLEMGQGQWLGDSMWLQRYQEGRWDRAQLPATPDFRFRPPYAFLVETLDGDLWLPAPPGLITRHRGGVFEQLAIPHELEHQWVTCVAEDREGNLWVGTGSEGIQRWQPRRTRSLTTRDGLAHDHAWALCESRDGSVWIGTDGGVSRLRNGEFTHVTEHDGLSRNTVRALAEDREGTLWIGTGDGLQTWRDGQLQRTELPGEWYEGKIRTVLAARAGGVWVGTAVGLQRFHDGQWRKFTTAEGLGTNDVRALLEDRTGGLWIGTFGGGLSCLRDGSWTTFRTPDGLSNDRVWALHEDDDGVLWIGTEYGLNRLERGHFTRFTTANGLPENLVNQILEDDRGWFWVGHDRGIYRVRRQELNQVAAGRTGSLRCVRYDETEDGVPIETNGQKSQPAGGRMRDGRLWFPTTRGVLVFDPARHREEETPPLLTIEQVRANGRIVYDNGPPDPHEPPLPRPAGAHLHFPPGGARVLEFRYAAITFGSPEKSRFKFRLLGLAETWTDAGTRHVAYFNDLRPGDYRFQVIAANHHGVWSEVGTSLGFRVRPFVHETWWFYAVTVLGATMLITLGVRWRVRELRRIHRLEQWHALDDQRRRIARDIHDEIGASLTQIVRLSRPIDGQPADDAPTDARTHRIAAVAEDTVDRLGEIVWANNPKYDTLEDLVAYLREYAAQYLAAIPLVARFEFPTSVPAAPASGLMRRHVLLVVKETLQNVVRHAEATHVEFGLLLQEGQLQLRIRDNGRGFAAGSLDRRGNGLGNMRERIAELGGTIAVASAPGHGTSVRVVVPIAWAGEPDRGIHERQRRQAPEP
jgi:ligand-binding sensor domain-containing protein/signal transduction histidine kinase